MLVEMKSEQVLFENFADAHDQAITKSLHHVSKFENLRLWTTAIEQM